MKFLIDSCVSVRICQALQAAGLDAEWVGNWPLDPGDATILAHAVMTGSIVVTLDSDFGALAVAFGHPHRGIVRLVGISAGAQPGRLLDAIHRYGADLTAGAIVTIEPDRVRIRPRDDAAK